MGNYLQMERKNVIIELKKFGWSNRKISRETGHDRETVSKILQKNSKPAKAPTGSEDFETVKCPPGQKSKAAEYEELIRLKLNAGSTAKTIYHDLLYEHSYTGGYDSVKRFVRKLKRKNPRLVGRIVTGPGEEAQVDFGMGAPVIDITTGQKKRPNLFKMILSNSRHSYEEVVWKQNTETFIQCHINAFNFFGGITKVIRIDNLKAGIIKCNWYDAIENPLYQSLARHYGFVILAHRPGVPRHKGKVESGIDYTQNALKGKTFRSIEEQNNYLKWWNRKIARTRIHGNLKKQVWYMFETYEKPALQPLPVKAFELFQCGTRKVHVDSHIQIDNSYYSVPSEYVGKEVDVRWTNKIIRIYYCEQLIKTHKKTSGKGRYITNNADLPMKYTIGQKNYRSYLEESGSKLGTHVLAWIHFLFCERGVCAYRVIQGVLRLKNKYSPEIINKACRISLENKIIRYSTVKTLCDEKVLEAKQLPLFSDNHEFLRSLKEYEIATIQEV